MRDTLVIMLTALIACIAVIIIETDYITNRDINAYETFHAASNLPETAGKGITDPGKGKTTFLLIEPHVSE